MVFIQSLFLILILIFLYRLARYISTPFLRKIGFYRYYSPMFFVMPFFKGELDIHLGTSWDFIKNRIQNPKKMMFFLNEGLISLSEDIAKGRINPNTILRGNTHFLKDQTLHSFGFKTKTLNVFEWILFALNYLELSLLYSLCSGRIALVPMVNVKIVTCRAADILKNCYKFEALKTKLSSGTKTHHHTIDMVKVA